MTVTIELAKPVIAHGVEVQVLELQEPTGDDVIASGYPFMITEAGPIPVAGNIAKLAVRMASVPLSTIKALSGSDFNKLVGGVLSFFGE